MRMRPRRPCRPYMIVMPSTKTAVARDPDHKGSEADRDNFQATGLSTSSTVGAISSARRPA